MNTGTTKPCTDCGAPIEDDRFFPLCDACEQIRDERMKAEKAKQEAEAREASAFRNEKAVDDETPFRIYSTNLGDPRFNAALWAKVQAWDPSNELPWLGIVGATGTCKSRCLHLRLRQLARQDALDGRPFKFLIIDGMEFSEAVANRYCDDKLSGGLTVGEAAKKFLRLAMNADVLLFDEIGKLRPSPAVIDRAFALIDERHRHNLCTLWSSNSDPETFCASWPAEYAKPGCGRILEASTIIRA